MKQVLFICTANICRSVMAAQILKKLLGGREDVSVLSAGVAPSTEYRISGALARVLGGFGVDCGKHRGTRVTVEMVENSDYVIVMEKRHKEFLSTLSPKHARKIFRIKEFSGLEEDFEDPLHHAQPDFTAVALEMEHHLRAFMEKEKF